MCAWRSTSRPRACSTGPTTARPGSSCCGPSSRRASRVEELREAAAHDRLALLPVERVLAGEGRLYTRRSSPRRPASTREFLDEAARALGVPVREPGERAITEEELELSRSAKALLDAGLSPEAFLELTAVMSRSMQNVAAIAHRRLRRGVPPAPGDTERDLGLRYAEALRNLGPARRPDAPADAEPAPARADARGRDQPGRAPERPAGGLAAGDRGLRRHRRLHEARGGRGARGPRRRRPAASSGRSRTPPRRRCGS